MICQIRYKITLLLCKVFGHRYKDETAWEFHGKIFDTCTRCNRIINVDEEVDDEPENEKNNG